MSLLIGPNRTPAIDAAFQVPTLKTTIPSALRLPLQALEVREQIFSLFNEFLLYRVYR
jgi:hypothetical protein